jgi:nucleoid DNA-binding protein
MNKQELISRIAEHDVFDTAKAAGEVLDIIKAVITEEIVAGNEVYLGQDFGGFKAATQAPRSGVSALNGEAYDTPAKQVIKFKPSAALKAAVAV